MAGVLALFTLVDSEALLNFEITSNGTVLFYLGVTGTIFAVTRGMIPDENQVFEPEKLLRQVVEHTHYLPAEWKHKLHTDQAGLMLVADKSTINHDLYRLEGSFVNCLTTRWGSLYKNYSVSSLHHLYYVYPCLKVPIR